MHLEDGRRKGWVVSVKFLVLKSLVLTCDTDASDEKMYTRGTRKVHVAFAICNSSELYGIASD